VSFLLDTNVLSAYLKGRAPRVQSKFIQHGGQLSTTAINLGELYVWADKSAKKADRRKSIVELLKHVACLDIDQAVAEHFASVRSQQLTAGTITPTLDLFVAAAALAKNFTLVTRNVSDFSSIPGLRVVDWES
jgi:tRNA(fMet)-specific endonuclease VapC